MKLSITPVILLLLLLTGCSSAPVPDTRYYLLNLPQATATAAQIKEHTTIVKILELPEYLNQAQMVMQMANHQLHYAHFHMWAEPLKAGFAKALTTDLNASGSDSRFIVDPRTTNHQSKLLVQLAFFHVGSDSTVTLSGHYWYEGKGEGQEGKEQNDNRQPFYFRQTLQQDGYAHAVSQMRKLVTQLAGQISS